MTDRATNNVPFQCLAADSLSPATADSAIKQKSPVKNRKLSTKDSSPMTNLETSVSDAVNSLERARV